MNRASLFKEALTMRTIQRIGGVLAALAVLSSVLACGAMGKASARQKAVNDMKQLGMMYHNFHDAKARGPESAAEWNALVSDPEEKALVSAVAAGEYVIYWNVKFPTLTAGTQNTVLGYEKKVPTEGGTVLMADGSVQQMTAEDFAAAPKADKFTKK
jgi:hypothetical protein